jgi:hypothetical protein
VSHVWTRCQERSGNQWLWRCSKCTGQLFSKKKPPPNQKVPILPDIGPLTALKLEPWTRIRMSCDEYQVHQVMVS